MAKITENNTKEINGLTTSVAVILNKTVKTKSANGGAFILAII